MWERYKDRDDAILKDLVHEHVKKSGRGNGGVEAMQTHVCMQMRQKQAETKMKIEKRKSNMISTL